MTAFVMPSLGADMESGTLVEWLVKPGDKVHKGDIVAVIETHKGAIDVEIFEEGTISQLCASVGETIPVGGILAELGEEGKRAPVSASSPVPTSLPPIPHPAPADLGATELPRLKASPGARRLAAEHGIALAELSGTGVGGSISLVDVELARVTGKGRGPAARTPEAAPEVRGSRGGGFDIVEMRRAIAAAMTRSKREIPHYYLASTVDMKASIDWLAGYNEARPPEERLLPAALLLKATALALRKHLQFNGFWQDDGFRPGAGIHVGWAISLRGGGLIAPAIQDADSLAVPEVMTKLRDLVGRARSGGLRSSELMDPTITITSLGERGADVVTGVIYPPQVAIIGFGRIRERPCIFEGQAVARQMVEVTLAADHRASDGHAGGLLLFAIEQALQEPEKL